MKKQFVQMLCLVKSFSQYHSHIHPLPKTAHFYLNSTKSHSVLHHVIAFPPRTSSPFLLSYNVNVMHTVFFPSMPTQYRGSKAHTAPCKKKRILAVFSWSYPTLRNDIYFWKSKTMCIILSTAQSYSSTL